MKAKISRFLVVTLGVSILGSFAIAPRATYGQGDDATTAASGPTTNLKTKEDTKIYIQQKKEETRQRIKAQKEYNDAYNRAFERAREAERVRLDEAGEEDEGGCCGGS